MTGTKGKVRRVQETKDTDKRLRDDTKIIQEKIYMRQEVLEIHISEYPKSEKRSPLPFLASSIV